MPHQKLAVTGLDNENQRRRLPEAVNAILTHQFDDSRVQTKAEVLAGVTVVNAAFPPGDVRRYGAKLDNVTNDLAAFEAAMDQAVQSGGAEVDGAAQLALISTTLTVPAGITFKNFKIRLGTPGDNLLEVGSGCRISGYLQGTGTTSTVERLIYPSSNAAYDVFLDVEVTNATYGVHLQQVSGSAASDAPHRWFGRIYAHDIVGTAGVTEGYGLLMSPAEGCQFVVSAKNIARHAVYLSAGARHNKIDVTIDGCNNYGVQLFSTSGQNATELNEVTVFATNMGENVAGQSGAIAVVQKSNYNKINVYQDGDGVSTYAITVEGSSGGPYPLANEIDGNITGQFLGTEPVRLLNADSTKIVNGMIIHAYGTNGCLGIRRTGTNGSVHAGQFANLDIDAQGQARKGIYNECNTQPSTVGLCNIRNNSTSLRVDDQTSGYMQGFTRAVNFSGTTASISATSTGDTSVSIPIAVATTPRRTRVYLRGSSVSFLVPSVVVGVQSPADDTHVGFRIYNAHSASQTFDYEGVVEGH